MIYMMLDRLATSTSIYASISCMLYGRWNARLADCTYDVMGDTRQMKSNSAMRYTCAIWQMSYFWQLHHYDTCAIWYWLNCQIKVQIRRQTHEIYLDAKKKQRQLHTWNRLGVWRPACYACTWAFARPRKIWIWLRWAMYGQCSCPITHD